MFAFRRVFTIVVSVGILLGDLVHENTLAQDRVETIADVTAAGAEPILSSDELELTLFARDPKIVTPIGLAIDDRDRLFVIESHTHLRPSNYSGPSSDRIKVFVDEDGDGISDRVEVFADGLTEAMNLAFGPDGDLYVVCAREVVRFAAPNGGLSAQSRSTIATLRTRERYAHNSLLGVTVASDGSVFIARGNTGSNAYELVGSDGSSVSGYGDGGSVIRMDPGGENVEGVATGFWNPFDLKCDHRGRLLLVDNDPDARGPNRLLQVLRGGDYGYKSMYGGSGTHPFQGWNGELPGTLPYIAGCGEAPSGLIDLAFTNFGKTGPSTTDVLVTIWNENSLERFSVTDADDGLSATKSVFLKGGKDFRPVAMAADSKGNLFITDWVKVDYPNHGHGKIWRVAARDRSKQVHLAATENSADEYRPLPDALLMEELVSTNPYKRHRLIQELANRPNVLAVAMSSELPEVRRAAFLASQRSEPGNLAWLRRGLADEDSEIRTQCLIWAAERFEPTLAQDLDQVLDQATLDPVEFRIWYEAKRNLQVAFCKLVKQRGPSKANKLERPELPDLLVQVIVDESRAAAVRAMAIEILPPQALVDQPELLPPLLLSSEFELVKASVKRLADDSRLLDDEKLTRLLQRVATDESMRVDVRSEAILALGEVRLENWSFLEPIVLEGREQIRYAAARGLRTAARRNASARELAADLLSKTGEEREANAAVAEQLNLASGKDEALVPASDKLTPADWAERSTSRGVAYRGKAVFYDSQLGCVGCHQQNTRGETLGPDLTSVRKSKSRSQIAESIMRPSAEFPPQYQAWQVVDADGMVHNGLQLDHKANGAIQMIGSDGRTLRFEAEDVMDYRASTSSLMPSGLVQRMTVQEFADLIEYLASRQETE